MENYNIDFCIKCGADTMGKDVCECGSQDFAFGDKISLIDSTITCSCGNTKFKIRTHYNEAPNFVTTYYCEKCSNIFGTEHHMPNIIIEEDV